MRLVQQADFFGAIKFKNILKFYPNGTPSLTFISSLKLLIAYLNISHSQRQAHVQYIFCNNGAFKRGQNYPTLLTKQCWMILDDDG